MISGRPVFFSTLERSLEQVADKGIPNIYGYARALMACSMLLTLAFTNTGDLFIETNTTQAVECRGVARWSLFCVAPDVEIAKVVAGAVLLCVISGLLPRYTVIPHWWVTFSFHVSGSTLEGGDQVAAIVTLCLIPVGLADGRMWVWTPRGVSHSPRGGCRLIARYFLTVVRVQAAVIYFVSGAAKFGEPQWQDGTAMYYWLSHPTFGAPEWQAPLYEGLLTSSTFVALITWTVPTFEVIVAAGLFFPSRHKKWLLAPILTLHVLIGFSMGLTSFAAVMIALDLLYLYPDDRDLPTPRDWIDRVISMPRPHPLPPRQSLLE